MNDYGQQPAVVEDASLTAKWQSAMDHEQSDNDKVDDDCNEEAKMFFTTSDLIQRINESVAEVSGGDSAPGTGFELRRQMPDGSTRRADAADTAVADLQSKIKQTAAVLSELTSEEKMEWAREQRMEGNRLFAKGKYHEAMDIYITCLVAMDKLKSRSGNESGATRHGSNDESEVTSFSEDIVRDIQLPVLLNLALCALKLGMLRKAESFCDFALQTELGKSSSKAYFRRGRARMLMGSYVAARTDLEKASELLTSSDDGSKDSEGVEKKTVRKELQKLERLEIQAKKHEVMQKKAMKRVWSSSRDTTDDIGGVDSEMNQEKPGVSESAAMTESDASSDYIDGKTALIGQSRSQNTGLYSDRREQRLFSTLTASTKKEKSGEDAVLHDGQSYLQWYLSLFERCLRKTLRVLGDEEGASLGRHDKDK